MLQYRAFLFVLLLTSIIYWRIGRRGRTWFLAFVAFCYVAALDVSAAFSAFALTTIVFLFSRYAQGPRWQRFRPTALVVLVLLAYLVFFKVVLRFSEFLPLSTGLANLVVPLGISYTSFKLIHYAIESSRGNLPEHGLGDFLAYIFLFPTFTAGPIERFDHFIQHRADRWSWDFALDGVTRIVYGVIKRFAIVELLLLPLLGEVTDARELVDSLSELPFYRVWWFLIVTYLIAYLDFSAYSDVAIGASRLYGLRIMENFHVPIAATNISEFWQRWHMTLAKWCQSYVYMPIIGLTRNPIAASYATFIAMGLWHAVSLHWICWGAYHATGIVVYQRWRRWRGRRRSTYLDRIHAYLAWLATFLFVSAGYAFTSGYGKVPIIDSFRILAHALGIAI